MKEHSIIPFIIVPSVGEYKLERKSIDIEDFINFIKNNFKDGDPENIRYYYVYHDRLMDLLNV